MKTLYSVLLVICSCFVISCSGDDVFSEEYDGNEFLMDKTWYFTDIYHEQSMDISWDGVETSIQLNSDGTYVLSGYYGNHTGRYVYHNSVFCLMDGSEVMRFSIKESVAVKNRQTFILDFGERGKFNVVCYDTLKDNHQQSSSYVNFNQKFKNESEAKEFLIKMVKESLSFVYESEKQFYQIYCYKQIPSLSSYQLMQLEQMMTNIRNRNSVYAMGCQQMYLYYSIYISDDRFVEYAKRAYVFCLYNMGISSPNSMSGEILNQMKQILIESLNSEHISDFVSDDFVYGLLAEISLSLKDYDSANRYISEIKNMPAVEFSYDEKQVVIYDKNYIDSMKEEASSGTHTVTPESYGMFNTVQRCQ